MKPKIIKIKCLEDWNFNINGEYVNSRDKELYVLKKQGFDVVVYLDDADCAWILRNYEILEEINEEPKQESKSPTLRDLLGQDIKRIEF